MSVGEVRGGVGDTAGGRWSGGRGGGDASRNGRGNVGGTGGGGIGSFSAEAQEQPEAAQLGQEPRSSSQLAKYVGTMVSQTMPKHRSPQSSLPEYEGEDGDAAGGDESNTGAGVVGGRGDG